MYSNLLFRILLSIDSPINMSAISLDYTRALFLRNDKETTVNPSSSYITNDISSRISKRFFR